MKVAERPPNEVQRLAALRRYDVLDTLPEEGFDEIARLASIICETPIATVCFVDENRQWFKAKVGLNGSENTREVSFCAHAILNPYEELVVEDALHDPRFFDNPLVTGDPKIRFYAGSPLQSAHGEALGTLCVIDRKPRALTPEQKETLRVLAHQLMAQLELRYALRMALEREAAVRQGDEEIRRLHREAEVRNLELEAQAGELQRVRDELETRVEKRTAELAHSNQTLERSNLELQQFAYVASHDLQSPLRSISGFVQLLRSEYEEKLDEQARDWIGRTVKAIEQMQELIQDLLSYSRVESGGRAFEPFPLGEVFQDAVAFLDFSIREAGGEVTCGELPVVIGDRSQLVQLLQNLIGNGLKYRGPRPPKIHVSARRAEQSRTEQNRMEHLGGGQRDGHRAQASRAHF
jgi:signal transduction histidine kinase